LAFAFTTSWIRPQGMILGVTKGVIRGLILVLDLRRLWSLATSGDPLSGSVNSRWGYACSIEGELDGASLESG
jgi:hypothetical protein